MKCQILFTGKNNGKKNVSKCHLLEFLPSMLVRKQIAIICVRKAGNCIDNACDNNVTVFRAVNTVTSYYHILNVLFSLSFMSSRKLLSMYLMPNPCILPGTF